MGWRGTSLGAPDGLVVTTLTVGSEQFVVLSFPLPSLAFGGRLSDAERDVSERLVAGDSHAEIARARKTSPRTVANQVAAIYYKLGVSSRRELAILGRKASGE